jgi:hypothetical protein
MKNSLMALFVSMLILSVQPVNAQDPMRYREFQLGSDVASVVTLIGAAPTVVKLLHQRPAVIEDVEYRPRYASRGAAPHTDPVELIVFRFYNGQLFRVVVDYDRNRTEGMTEADMIEAITAEYGPASRVLPAANRISTLDYGAADTPVAIWEGTESSVTLLRVAYPVSFRLAVAFTRLDNLARTASAEAVRLDTKEAPQREIARQKKESDEARAALQKAKTENKAVFRP